MAVGSGVPYNEYTGNGVTTVFAYGFTLLRADDLVVTINGVATSAYTVSGLGVAAGGAVTFTAAPANGADILLERVIALVRSTEYQNNGDLQAATVNDDFDRLWLAVQQSASGLGGISSALRVSSDGPLTELPAAASRLDRLPCFDSSTGDAELTPFTVTQLSSAIAAAYSGMGTADAATFIAAGAGAVGRTMQAKGRERVSVDDFGVLPGSTDYSAQIANAIASCADGDTLYFPTPGLYVVSATTVDAAIVLPVGVDLEMAPGAWLTAATSFGSFIAPLGRNRIQANIDGAGYPTTGGVTGTWGIENVGIRAYFSAPIGLGATDVTIHGCNIKNVSFPVMTHGAQRWNVTRNRFTRYKQTGLLMGFSSGYNSTGNLIHGNHFDDAGDYAVAYYQVGGFSAGVGSHNITAFNHAKNMNQRTNGYAFGVEQGVAANQHHFTFYGNTYETAGSVTVTVGGVTISTCTDSVASMNVLTCPTGTQAKGVNCVSSVNCTISGNVLDGWTDTSIDTDGSNGVTIEGNTIRDCGGASPTYPAVRLAATLDTSNIRFIGANTVTISPAYAFSGSTVAAVLALSAPGKTVKNITVKGGVFTNPNDRCVSIEGTLGIPIVNAEVSGLTVNGIGSATFFRREIAYLSYVNDLTVVDNVAFDAIRGIAAVNCVGGLIARNEFKGTQTITTLYDITGSTGLKIRDDVVTTPVTTAITPTARLDAAFTNYAQRCSSIVTEAQGSTGAIATGATVTHGMFAAPTQVSLTPNAAAVACAVTAKGATTFTVAFAGGGTQTFDWQAVIR